MKKYGLLIFLLSVPIYLLSQNFDIDLLRKINLDRNTDLDTLFICVANSTAYIAYALPFLFLLFGWIKKVPIIMQKAFYMGASVLASGIISTLLKLIVERPRPFDLYPELEKLSAGGSYSFPSGHTADAFAFATAICIAYPRWYVIIPAYAWAGAVGYSRMDLGVHYPSDVMAGVIIGAATSVICFLIQKWMIRKWMRRQRFNKMEGRSPKSGK